MRKKQLKSIYVLVQLVIVLESCNELSGSTVTRNIITLRRDSSEAIIYKNMFNRLRLAKPRYNDY